MWWSLLALPQGNKSAEIVPTFADERGNKCLPITTRYSVEVFFVSKFPITPPPAFRVTIKGGIHNKKYTIHLTRMYLNNCYMFRCLSVSSSGNNFVIPNLHASYNKILVINLLDPELFFLVLAHSVYKMRIIQEPNTIEL